MRFKGILKAWLCVLPVLSGCGNSQPVNTSVDAEMEKRIDALMQKMTLEDKVGQMYQVDPGVFGSRENLKQAIRDGKIGSLLNAIGAENVNELQRVAVEESRLGIPLVIGRDVIHGYRTIMPIPLGMAASWNEDLIRESMAVAAKEAASMGIHWTFAPMIDVSRDGRWGRIAESAGEDPLLNVMVARAMVQGFQGDDLSNPNTIAACAKHFVGYGAAEGGRDYNTTVISDLDMHNVYLPPFKEAVKNGAATIMTAFNEINGIPASGHEKYVRKILKEKWGFNGMVVSDWASIAEMIPHGFAADEKHAAELGLKAGVDMEMSSPSYINSIPELIKEGKITMNMVDDAVRRVLRLKMRLGLFENPYTEVGLSEKVLLHPNHLEISRKLAAESMVLLKNENNLLPLKKGTKIALIGPLADQPHEQLGTWIFDGKEQDTRTIYPALVEANGTANVNFVSGLAYSRDKDTKQFADVVKAIDKSDVVIAVLGEESILSGEAKSLAELKFPGKQTELLRLAASRKKPVILVVMAGRPFSLLNEEPLVQSILFAWHPGTMGGPALADLIFGDIAPSGKLPITYPKGEGQIPIYYAHKNTGRPASASTWTHIDKIPVKAVQHSLGNTSHYLDYGYNPLYPFGFGLSYTTFEYSDIKVSSETIKLGESVVVEALIKNTGNVKGTEIVQLYTRDLVASYTRPVRELKAFTRLTLEPGESAKVRFELGSEQLGFYHPDGTFVVESGEFDVWIAPDAASGLKSNFVVKP